MAPRSPLSAYLHFVAINRPKLNKDYPEKNFAEIAKILGHQWRTLGGAERRRYEVLAYADKRRYQDEKDKWTAPLQRTHSNSLKGKKKDSPNKGKRKLTSTSTIRKPSSAYAVWAVGEREQLASKHPDLEKKELTKLLREKWRNIAPLEKSPYIAQAQRDKERYDQELRSVQNAQGQELRAGQNARPIQNGQGLRSIQTGQGLLNWNTATAVTVN